MSMISPAPVVWSRVSANDLTAGLLSPFSWSILSRSAEQAIVNHYQALGYDLPADTRFWRRFAGRAYLNTTALAAADQAVTDVASGSSSLGQRLRGRDTGRRAAVLRHELAQAPNTFAAIQRWREKVQASQWRQATILQIMEEIEPHAAAVLSAREHLISGLGSARRQITHWLASWLPNAPDALFDALFAGLDGREGLAGYRHDLAGLALAAGREPAVLTYLPAGDWPQSAPEGAFRRAFEQFMATHGYWGEEPLEAAGPRWTERPADLLARVAADLAAPASPLPVDPEQARQQRAEAADHVARQLGLLRRRQFEPAFEQLQQIVALLPASRAALVAVMAAARHWALGAAHEAAADGRLAAIEDVFLLELEELKQMMTGEWSSPAQVQLIVRERRAQQMTWAAQAPPEVIEAEGEGLPWSIYPETAPTRAPA